MKNSHIDSRRVRKLCEGEINKSGPVIYWMDRDRRLHDNWAFLYAQELSQKLDRALQIVFCKDTSFLSYPEEIKDAIILRGKPEEEIQKYCTKVACSALVTDFSPLRVSRKLRKIVSDNCTYPFYEVDAHNIVPCLIASNKQEYGAYTLRPKINRLLPEFLTEFPTKTVPNPVLEDFIQNRLHGYSENRNDPNKNGQSGLSPLLHSGHISAQRIALEVIKSSAPEEDKKAFLEELIVRRELADNYCFYNKNYDSFLGFHSWGQETLNKHRKDKRDFTYTSEQFENAQTHDPLWNAAQNQMITQGKMHGYMRMYWAKKILEWTLSPEEAMSIAIYLNDRYELDGRDPNGYAGIAWAIGGVHDRPWAERPIFGMVRYMNYNGCARKFDVQQYIHKYTVQSSI